MRLTKKHIRASVVGGFYILLIMKKEVKIPFSGETLVKHLSWDLVDRLSDLADCVLIEKTAYTMAANAMIKNNMTADCKWRYRHLWGQLASDERVAKMQKEISERGITNFDITISRKERYVLRGTT